MTITTLNTAVDTMLSIAGSEFCHAKFINQSTVETIRNDEILCAHVDPEVEGDAIGREINRFILMFDLTVPLLEAILPHVGTTGAAGVYTGDTTLSTCEVMCNFGATTHRWSETIINRMIIRGGVSTVPISVELHCAGVQEEDVASPTFTPGTIEFIYGFPGTALTIAGTSYDAPHFAFVVDRNLVFDWNSSRFITGYGRGKRQTLLATSTPYLSGKKAVYWDNKTNLTGRDVTLLTSNGTKTVTFRLQLARLIPKGPSIDDLQIPIRLPMTWDARRQVAGSVPAFTVSIVTL